MIAPFPIRLIVVLGPTGSGKSELALDLAEQLGGEIVNCDSVQVYRGFEVGAAKTPPSERRNIPHHLIDVIGPGEELTAGAYARLTRPVINDIHARDRVPVVVGGTGFYVRALLEGLSPAPARDPQLRQRLHFRETRRPGFLYRALRRCDPVAATRIHANDTPKLIRAIEISSLSGRPASQAQSAPRDAFSSATALKLGLSPDRKLLYTRLNERTAWMFHHGLIEETERLLGMGYTRDSKPMQSLGYKQALLYLEDRRSLGTAMVECQAKTRQYAKRQVTWFRAEQNVQWLNDFGSDNHVKREALERSRKFLAHESAT